MAAASVAVAACTPADAGYHAGMLLVPLESLQGENPQDGPMHRETELSRLLHHCAGMALLGRWYRAIDAARGTLEEHHCWQKMVVQLLER